MNDEQVRALRAPFPASAVGKLPRTTCKACSDSNSKVCDKHQKRECQGCGNWMTTAHIHLDYVGHAEVTDRLLSVDPQWSWEPLAFAPDGGPLIRQSGKELTLWGRLTIGGVTRLGVGSVAANTFEAEKQLIGDFVRNAAMRFGVALDLWSKTELESASVVPQDPVPQRPAATSLGWASEELAKESHRSVGQRIKALPAEWIDDFNAWMAAQGIPWPCSPDQLEAVDTQLRGLEAGPDADTRSQAQTDLDESGVPFEGGAVTPEDFRSPGSKGP